MRIQESGFPDNGARAAVIGADYLWLGDFDKADDWFERAYERREGQPFKQFFSRGLTDAHAIDQYRLTPGYKALAAKPLFREWQAEHDRIAAALAAHKDPLQ